MSGDYRISAQDGFAAYCRAYDKTQRKLQESGMPRAVKAEYVARIVGNKVCYCQLATDANSAELDAGKNLDEVHL